MGIYKPPLKCVEVVPIDIIAPPFEIKKRVLGTNASLVKQVTSDVGGATRGVRIRIRGIGSGFYEGASELQEAMHFNVCAETEELLQEAVARMKQIIQTAKTELAQAGIGGMGAGGMGQGGMGGVGMGAGGMGQGGMGGGGMGGVGMSQGGMGGGGMGGVGMGQGGMGVGGMGAGGMGSW